MFDTFNEGIAIFKKEKKSKIDLNSDKKKQEYDEMGKIRFDVVSKRQQDTEFIESKGRTLSMKIKIPINPIVTKELTVFIKKDCFSIVETDEDKKKNRMFLYLEKVVL